jgi:hypothetical protein
MFVYLIVNHVTGKIYVGKHKGDNLKKYLQQKLGHAKRGESERSHLYNSMRKHPDHSVWSVHPLIFDCQSNEELCHWERILIKALAAQNPEIGYNICRGGEGRTGPLSSEEKIKFRAANKAYWARLNNLTGQTFNQLSVQSRAETKRGKQRWNCQCACGKPTTVTTNALKSGAVKSCGCLIAKAGRTRWAKQNIVGQVFGWLTVESEAGRYRTQRQWNCLCACGNPTVARTNSLRSGNTKSCGGCGATKKRNTLSSF